MEFVAHDCINDMKFAISRGVCLTLFRCSVCNYFYTKHLIQLNYMCFRCIKPYGRGKVQQIMMALNKKTCTDIMYIIMSYYGIRPNNNTKIIG